MSIGAKVGLSDLVTWSCGMHAVIQFERQGTKTCGGRDVSFLFQKQAVG